MSAGHTRGRGHIGDTLTYSLLFLERHPVRLCSGSLLRFRLAIPTFTAETRVECMRFCPAIRTTMARMAEFLS